MRPCRVLLLLALVLPAPALADDFSDFRIPDHHTSALRFGLSGNFSRLSTVIPEVSSRNTNWAGNGNLTASWAGDSDPREWDLVVGGAGFGAWLHDVTDGFSAPGPGTAFANLEDQRQARAAENWQIAGGGRLYPGAGRFGFGAHASLGGIEQQMWNTHSSVSDITISGVSQRSESQIHDQESQYQEDGRLDLTAGYGRVRDATPVFDAILLEERLDRDHALAHPLTRAGRQRIADLFALRSSFSLVHDLPDKFFWSEVDRILREDGALPERGIDAYALRHADDALVVGRFFPRNVGFFVGPALSARHSHRVARFDETDGSRFFSNGTLIAESLGHIGDRSVASVDQTFYGAQAEYHRPIGDRAQLDVFERGLVDVKGDPDALEVEGQVGIARLIGERWLFSASFGHQRTLDNRPLDLSRWAITMGGSIDWYLEDFLRLGLLVVDQQAHERPGSGFFFFPPPSFPITSSVEKTFRASLSFTIARGHLSAPGLGVSQRSLR